MKKKPNSIQISALHVMMRRVVGLLNPPPCLKIWEWAELRRRMGRNVTAKPGRYQVATTPYMREPQESFTHPDVQTTVLYMAKRTGKTEGELNLIGATIEQNPRNILIVYPTLDSAKKWSKQFFEPMRKSTPAIRRLIGDRRSRESNNTILSKEFPGGTISAIGSNSPSGFRQVQAPVVICDEVDAMEAIAGGEGDPVTLAFGRAENYSDSVQIVSSTATEITAQLADGEEMPEKFDSGSRIHNWWLRSDRRKWFVKNPCCGKWHVLMWGNVKWPEGHQHEKAYYECPDCKAQWNDELRIKAVLSGEWRATAPFHGVRGYWLNGLNTTFSAKKGYKSKLHQMAAEFWEAYTGGADAMKAWQNTFLCEPKYVEPEKMDASPFYERLEDYQPDNLPEDVCVIGLVVDVQGDRLEYEFVGLGEDDETWGIEYGKIQGDPEKDAVWKTLTDYTKRAFKREDGADLKVDFVAIDHRHKGSRVRSFIKKCGHPRCYAMYGAGGADKQSLLVIPHKNRHYRMNLYSVGTHTAKDILFARMKLTSPGARYMHYPNGNGYERQKDGYFDQLTAEELKVEIHRGKIEKFYQKRQGHDRNEALDLRVYFLAAVDVLRPAISVIKKELKRKLAAEKAKPVVVQPASRVPTESTQLVAEQPKARKRFSFRKGGF